MSLETKCVGPNSQNVLGTIMSLIHQSHRSSASKIEGLQLKRPCPCPWFRHCTALPSHRSHPTVLSRRSKWEPALLERASAVGQEKRKASLTNSHSCGCKIGCFGGIVCLVVCFILAPSQRLPWICPSPILPHSTVCDPSMLPDFLGVSGCLCCC